MNQWRLRGALLALVVLSGLAREPALAGVVEPLQGIGNIPFAADLPVFRGEDGVSRVRATVRVFDGDLVPASGTALKRLSLRLKLAQEGRVAVDTLRSIEFQIRPSRSDDLRVEPFRLLEIEAPIGTGTWAVTLDLSDSQRRKSRATGVLYVPDSAGPVLSDPEFQFGTGARMLPWPDRIYGLAQDTLEVYFEIGSVEAKSAGPATFRFEVHDPDYGLLDSQELSLDLEPGANAAQWKLPVGDFPEGSYGLRIVPPWGEEGAVFREFSVAWRVERAVEGGDDLYVEAELALPARDLERFRGLSRSRQIAMLDALWDSVDPTPGTDRNELRDEFRERIAFANQRYRPMQGIGALTDRGRLHVRLGQPDEIDVEVMPGNGEDLELAIQGLHDIYTPEIEGVMARGDLLGDDGIAPGIRPRELGGTALSSLGAGGSGSGAFAGAAASEIGSDLRRNAASVGREAGFEVWKYQYEGNPLLEWHRPGMAAQQHLRFIFVDRRGIGEYHMEFSNLPNPY